MQAIRVHAFGDESVLKLETLPTPMPGKGQAVVALKAVGVNPVETYIRAGTYPVKPPLPYTPGSDAAGVVEAVGEGMTAFKPGDRVYLTGCLTGTYATHAVANESQLQVLPAHLSFEQGAGLHVPYYTAYKGAFLRGEIKPGDTVLIHGATGGVGLAAVQWLRKLGVRLLATGGSQDGRDLLHAQGVTEVFDHKAPGYVDAIKAATPRGITVILEMLANLNLPKDLPLLAPKGRVIVIGNRGETTLDARHLMGKDADIRGMSLGNASPTDYAQMHSAVALGLASRELDPIIAKRFPLSEAGAAHKAIMTSTAAGKIVLLP